MRSEEEIRQQRQAMRDELEKNYVEWPDHVIRHYLSFIDALNWVLGEE